MGGGTKKSKRETDAATTPKRKTDAAIPPKPEELPSMPEGEKPAPVVYRGAKVSLQKSKWRGGIPAHILPGVKESKRECTCQFAAGEESKKQAFLQLLERLDGKLDNPPRPAKAEKNILAKLSHHGLD